MDRFNRGFLAGIIAGIPMNIWDLASYHLLKFSNLRYLDWGSIMLFGRLPENTVQITLGLVSQLMWVGLLGIIFSYLVPLITSRKHVFKGAVYGYLIGFVIYSIPVVFGTKYLSTSSTGTTITQLIGGLIWGITLAEALRKLDEKRLVN